MGKSRIEKPYYLNKNDWEAINSHFKGSHENWKLIKFDDFKDRIRTDLRIKQDNRCCYCKKILKYDKKEVDIEHIIPKAKRPRFTFLNYNLALSCPACNTTKNQDMPIVDSNKQTFPYKSEDYLIIHPHFDNYFQEIEIVNDIFIKSKGPKGAWTIEHCELDTIEKVKDKILDLMITKQLNKKSIHSLLIQLTLNIADPDILDTITTIIDEIKQKKYIIP